jgi:hypothetical protein
MWHWLVATYPEIAENSPQQQYEDSMAMGAVITS